MGYDDPENINLVEVYVNYLRKNWVRKEKNKNSERCWIRF